MGVAVIVPFQGGDPTRERAARWVLGELMARRYTVALAEHPGVPWSKPRAILHALPRIPSDSIVVVHDADSWCDGLPEAVRAVQQGAPWAVPHRLVHRLTPESTREVYAGTTPHPRMACVRRPYRGTAGGAIVVAPHHTLTAVPPDPRFEGWGGEDAAWRDALRTLAGMEWRTQAEPLYHLHHTPAPRAGLRGTASPGNVALAARYKAARGDDDRMRALIAEHQAVPA